MPFLFKLSKRLSVAHWEHAAFVAVLPSVVDVLDSVYLLAGLLIYATYKGFPPLWRAVRRWLILKIEFLPYPNKRQWCIPADTLKRWTDPDRVKMVKLSPSRAGYPVVYLGIRGMWPVIRKQ